ncbi:MAG: transglycosylase SLT domain-containing protein [Proteobacteria bacterium]|nr:transglycosylase SLT domain-containing protein [Pseudomonadota bacterium]
MDFVRQLSGKRILMVMAMGLFLMAGASHATPVQGTEKPVADVFPVNPSIAPNVAFWTDVFSRYTQSHGIIHDARHLGRIYEVISLDTARTVTAEKKNKRNKQLALEKYERILLALGAGTPPATATEKKVAKLFSAKAGPAEYNRAAREVRCQTGISQQFKEGLIRSGSVIAEFKRIFHSHGLPTDLVYLPCVESSFDFTAYSKFGAAGVWQFTQGTGKMYMEIGYVVDQRRDPFISADAAARLLKKNYAHLKDWPLAVTAYNHGLNGMLRAQQQKGSYENIFNTYQSASFKFASRNFYPEFLAARHVAKNYKQYFGDIPFQKPVQVTRFTTKGYVSASALARGLNLDIQTLQELNPSLRTPVFDGRKHIPQGFELRLPKHMDHKTISRVTASLLQKTQKPSKFHVVRKGDTAGSIARTHAVSLNDLAMANGLGRKATIYIGQNLRIPVPGEMVPPIKLAQAKPQKPAEQKEPIKTAPALPATPEQAPPVKMKGRIAEPIPPTALPTKVAAALPEAPPIPEAGLPETAEALAKPVSEKPAVNLKIITSDLKIQKTFTRSNQLVGLIQVAPEETLGHYADWLQIPTHKIRTLNRLPHGDTISIDQKIQIPLAKKDRDQFEELRYEYHKEMEEDFFESFSISSVETYEIKNGDTIWSLCLNDLEIPLWLLKKYNPAMDFGRLQPRNKLVYPIVSSRKNIRS